MEETIFVVANVDKRGIEALNNLFNGAKVNVSYSKPALFCLIVEFYKRFVFKKGYTTSVLSGLK